MSKEKIALAEICSVLQYLEDRGDLQYITKVQTKVRYTNIKEIDKLEIKVGKTRIEVTAREI